VPTAIDHHALLRPVLHLLKRKRIADHIAGQLAAALRIVRSNKRIADHIAGQLAAALRIVGTNTDCVINRKIGPYGPTLPGICLGGVGPRYWGKAYIPAGTHHTGALGQLALNFGPRPLFQVRP